MYNSINFSPFDLTSKIQNYNTYLGQVFFVFQNPNKCQHFYAECERDHRFFRAATPNMPLRMCANELSVKLLVKQPKQLCACGVRRRPQLKLFRSFLSFCVLISVCCYCETRGLVPVLV